MQNCFLENTSKTFLGIKTSYLETQCIHNTCTCILLVCVIWPLCTLYLHHDFKGIREYLIALRHSIELCLLYGQKEKKMENPGCWLARFWKVYTICSASDMTFKSHMDQVPVQVIANYLYIVIYFAVYKFLYLCNCIKLPLFYPLHLVLA